MASGDCSFNIRYHGILIDETENRVKCHHCGMKMSGFYQLKCHLGGIPGDVTVCKGVSDTLKEGFRHLVLETRGCSIHQNVQKRTRCTVAQNAIQQVSSPIRRVDLPTGSADKMTVGASSSQSKKNIGRFFYEMGIDLSIAKTMCFRNMITAGKEGYAIEIPSCDELKGSILTEQVMEMHCRNASIRQSWSSTGCSILLDGWIGPHGGNLVNFIVDCPQGTIFLSCCDVSAAIGDGIALQSLVNGVIEEVGADNVVQIIASSTTGWMECVGKQFMESRGPVFWTVCASHCIELILEKMIEMEFVRQVLKEAKTLTWFIYGHAAVLELFKRSSGCCELIKPCKVSSAMTFMTLKNILSKKKDLMNMLDSVEWQDSSQEYGIEGNRVVNLLMNNDFWHGVSVVAKASTPLVDLLVWINKAITPQVGYLYEAMDLVKENISKELPDSYEAIWDLIDEIWNSHLHSPLHIAGYYLNPSIFYGNFHCDDEVETGWKDCCNRMLDQQFQETLCSQQDMYEGAQGNFHFGCKPEEVNKYQPGELAYLSISLLTFR